MGVNHIVGWFYGKLPWNRIWCHTNILVAPFALGPRANLIKNTKIHFKVREFANGKEVKKFYVDNLAQGLPAKDIDKGIAM